MYILRKIALLLLSLTILILPAYLLVHGLLELLVVDDSSDLALAVCSPVGCGHLDGRVANINPLNTKQLSQQLDTIILYVNRLSKQDLVPKVVAS